MKFVPSSGTLRYGAVTLTLITAITYFAAVSTHFREGWVYPLFLLAVTLLQGIYGLMLLTEPWAYDSNGYARSDAAVGAARFYQIGALGNVLLLVIDLLWHVAGAARNVSGVTFSTADIVFTVVEVMLIGTLIALRHQVTTRIR